MWDLYTERARRTMYDAQKEALSLGVSSLTPEHFLLALTREDDSVAAYILASMGVTREEVRGAIEHEVERGNTKQKSANQNAQFTVTPAAKKVLDLAFEQHQALGHSYIGTEHLLLGIIAEGRGLAARVLADKGIDLDRTRQAEEALRKSRDST